MSQKHFEETMKATGIWNFYITKGEPLSNSELDILRGGGKIGREVSVQTYKNIIPTVSRQQMCKALSGNISTVTEIKITHQQLGTGTTAPANGDTALETPSVGTKVAVSSLAYSSNKVNVTAFWAAGTATGTWKEFGTFMNTTVLFNRAAIDIAITASDSLTIDGTVTFT